MHDAGHVSEFHRIGLLPPYVFEEVNALKARLRGEGCDVIDFGMGNPDLPVPPHILEKLLESAQKPKTNRYSMSRGVPGLRRAMAASYARRFGVELDPEREVIATLGSKEGFANLAQAITAPGDLVLAPDPAYPIHAFGFIIAGAAVRALPAPDAETYLRHLAHALESPSGRIRALVFNYPSNPTAETADLAVFQDLVALARRHEVWVLSDLAYSEIFFENDPPPSILQVDGARDIAVELNSLSKTYSMAGFRVGFAAGNAKLIAALARMKSYLDYGAYLPIQVAAAAALNGPQDCVAEIRATYRARRDVLVSAFQAAGWDVPPPKATMFAWAPIPERFRAMGSVEFAKALMREAEVAVSPGVGFGAAGDGHVRISLVENEQRIRQAARQIKAFITG